MTLDHLPAAAIERVRMQAQPTQEVVRKPEPAWLR
jgi:hypothetical protein